MSSEQYPRTHADVQQALSGIQIGTANMIKNTADFMLLPEEGPFDERGFLAHSEGPITYTSFQGENKVPITKRIPVVEPTPEQQIPHDEYSDWRRLDIKENLSIVSGSMLDRPEKRTILDTLATGRASQMYSTSLNFTTYPGSDVFKLSLAVGEYGPGFTIKQLKTAYHVIRHTDPLIHSYVDYIGDTNEKNLRFTYHGREYFSDTPYREPVPDAGTALEAIKFDGDISILQALSILTAEKVPGFDTAEELWASLRQTKAVEQLTARLTFGQVAILSTMGAFIPGLVKNKGGEAVLDTEIADTLKQQKQDFIDDTILPEIRAGKPQTPQDILEISQHRQGVGLTCPGVKHIAVQQQYLADVSERL